MIKENHYKKLIDMFSLSIDPKIGEGKIEEEIKFYPNIIGLQRFTNHAFRFFTKDVEKTEKLQNIFIELFESRNEVKRNILILKKSIKIVKKIKEHSDDMRDLCQFFSGLTDFIDGKLRNTKQGEIFRFLQDIKYR